MRDTNRRVQTIVDEFVAKLTQVAREEAANLVLGGLGSTGRSTRSVSSNGSRGAKPTAEDLAQLEQRVLAFVGKHPGLRIEQINAEMGTSTKDLALPIRKLVASRKLKTVGQRRATKYFAGGGGSAAAKNGTKPKARGSKGRRHSKS